MKLPAIHGHEFEPKLGRIGNRGVRSAFLRDVAQAVARAGGRSHALSRRAGQLGRIGRGAGVGRVLGTRDRYAAFRRRRVIVKTRLIKLAGRGTTPARAHLRYLQRDGVTREGQPGDLYDAAHDRADGDAFLGRGEGDRHQFRFIVSAEDATEFADLKDFTRRLMQQMEQDLGSKLDWVAVDHYNTGHPHTHIVLRGKDDRGRDLIIAREYLSHGTRERAAEIISLDLGPRSDREIEARLRAEVEQERFTSLDRALLKEVGEQGLLRSGTTVGDAFQQTLRAGRLQKLRHLGLAQEIGSGQWKLASDLELVLRRLGERGDIIKTLHHELARQGLARSVADYIIYEPAEDNAQRLVGRVVARGLSNELNDRRYVIVDGVDGRTHYVDIGQAGEAEPIPVGGIVAIEPKRAEPRAVDRTVAEIAAAHDGRYSVDLHLHHDPTARQAFAEAHVRRLEAMRRAGVDVTREKDGAWIIAPEHLERAVAFERAQARRVPVVIETMSTVPLERQGVAEGATWLDRELLVDAPTITRDAGFGREVREALARRRQWLIEQELARAEQDRVIYRANLLGLLRRRELVRVGARLSSELELPYAEAQPGGRIEGTYRRRLDLASGRFALIDKGREFTLVPWRPVLERHVGKEVSGVAHGETISWTIGRQRRALSVS
ncbi:Type IV secretory pathway, VirD2 components (relaxase) [Enhydrobacter aerosaccus]|uniref:Type IV secretory pathway, VirD2 components (Relaxase) n=1 Tax=Enhydrobacter aerosaccus TaxID=225324 RepID=A0A1T4JLA3_9HYPH|nr:relaxase/mobilization nuclease RlxS [Enhydrobacter aerosaccus]SJZ30908.1 Type IV secretory pathway, VirD2 components (relaxase) [Enhydrobacter aerosaccus]